MEFTGRNGDVSRWISAAEAGTNITSYNGNPTLSSTICYNIEFNVGSHVTGITYDTVVCAGTSASVTWSYKGNNIHTFTSTESYLYKIIGGTSKHCDSTVTYTVHFADACVLDKDAPVAFACNSYNFQWKDKNDGKNFLLKYTGSNPVTKDTVLQNQRCNPAVGHPTYKIRPTYCDSIYHLSVTIYQNTSQTVNATECGSYDWNFAYDYNGTGNTKGTWAGGTAATFNQPIPIHLAPGVGNHTYKAIVNNSDGCEDTVTLNLTINSGGSSEKNVAACRSYEFRYDDPNGTHNTNILHDTYTQTTSGSQTITDQVIVPNILGCDSTITLHLLLVGDDSTTIDTVVCRSSGNYTLNGTPYIPGTDGVEQQFEQKITDGGQTSTWSTYSLTKKCDSVYTINLTTFVNEEVSPSKTVCENPYTWFGTPYTTPGVKDHTSTKVVGTLTKKVCDSIYHLNLTFATTKYGDTSIVIDCETYNWVHHNHPGKVVPGTMGKRDTIQDTIVGVAAGCDSIYTLFLTKVDTVNIEEHAECDSYTWHTIPYTNNIHFDSTNRATVLAQPVRYRGSQIAGTTNPACKKVDFLYLTIYPSYNGGVAQDTTPMGPFCGFYSWSPYTSPSTKISKTITYEEVEANSGNYTTANRLSNAWTAASKAAYDAGKMDGDGCDSIRRLVLTKDVTIFSKIQRPLSVAIADTHYHCDSVTIGILQAGDVHMAYEENSVLTENQAAQLKIKANKISGIRILNVFDTIKNGSATGCDSISHIIYKVIPNVYTDDTNKGCDSVYYSTTWYKTSTQLEKYGQRKANTVCGGKCDSVFTISIIVNKSTKDTQTLYACDSAIWGHTIYTWVSGSKAFSTADLVFKNDIHDYSVVDSLHRKNNCDSILYLDLTLYKQSAIDTIVEDTAWCHSFRWHLPNATYRDYIATGSVLSTTDRYTKVLDPLSSYRDPANFICDTTYKMNITVFPKVYDTTAMAGCDSVILPTDNYGFARKVFDKDTVTIPWAQHIAAHPLLQCDSLHSYIVTVNHGSRKNIDTVVCDSATFHTLAVGHANYKKDTTIRDTIHAWDINGCEVHDTISVHIVHNGYKDTVVANECDEYWWNGFGGPLRITHDTLATFIGGHGTIYRQFTDAFGTHEQYCDTLHVLNLTIRKSSSGDTTAKACEQFYWHYTATTYDTDNYDPSAHLLKATSKPILHKIDNGNSVGCDTTITLTLNFNFTSRAIDVQNVGTCDSFLWHGRKFYKDTLMPLGTFDTNYNPLTGASDTSDINGCDTLTRLNLTMHYSTIEDFGTHETCDTFYWEQLHRYNELKQGKTLDREYGIIGHTTSITIDSVLERRFPSTSPYHNQDNCDSIVRVKVIIWGNSTNNMDTVVGCDSIVWGKHDKVYRESFHALVDSLRDTLLTIHGCDSIIYLIPFIHNATEDTLKQDTHRCAYYNWHTEWAYGSGSYDSTFTFSNGGIQYDTIAAKNSVGCDSIITLTVHLYDTRREDFTTEQMNLALIGEAKSYFCDTIIWRPSNRGGTHILTKDTICHDTILNAFSFGDIALCDSIYTLTAHFHYSTEKDTLVNTGCDSVLYKAVKYFTDTTLREIKIPNGNTAGCDSIWNVQLKVKPSTHNVSYDTFCDTYTWTNSHGRWTSTPTWDTTFVHSHADNTVAEPFVKTHIYNNVQNCKSADTLYLLLNPTDTSTLDTFGCRTYRWRKSNITLGTYIDTSFYVSTDTAITRSLNVFGCKHFDSISLSIHNDVDTIVDTIACNSFVWMDGATLTKDTSGVGTRYMPGIKTPYGCDSIFYLNLHMHRTETTTDDTTVCGEFEWKIDSKNTARNGGAFVKYTSTQTIEDIAKTIYGCDSVITMSLTVNAVTRVADDTIGICENIAKYDWSYTRDGNPSYNDEVENPLLHHGATDTTIIDQWDNPIPGECPIEARLYMYVKYKVYDTVHIDTCRNYAWATTTYSWSETFNLKDTVSWTKTNGAANGCDSIATLTISFDSITGTKLDTFACDSFAWVNRTHLVANYTTAGTYYDTTTVLHKCPYVDTINLAIKYAKDHYDTLHVKACTQYTWKAYADSLDSTIYKSSPAIYLTKRVKHRSYANGCDSTRWLDLDLHYNKNITENLEDKCDSVKWYDTTIYVAVNAPSLIIGGNSIKHIIHDAEYGCDTTYYLNVNIHPSWEIDDGLKQVCDSFIWDGTHQGYAGTYIIDTLRHGIEPDGLYIDTLDWKTTEKGCKIIHKITFQSKPSVHYDTVKEICHEYTWLADNRSFTYTASKDTSFTHSHPYAEECDTTWSLSLIIGERTVYNFDTIDCDSIEWKGVKYYSSTSISGIYLYDTIHRVNDCDSVRKLNMIINKTVHDTFDSTRCNSYKWPLVTGSVYSVEATYKLGTFTATNGCDSNRYIHFIVPKNTDSVITIASVCDKYIFNFDDSNYVFTKPVTDTVLTIVDGNSDHCDSTVTFTLSTILHSSIGDSIIRGCKPFVWNGNSYTNNTIDTISLGPINQQGCDSLSRVVITVDTTNYGIDSVELCATSHVWLDGERRYSNISASSPSAPKLTLPKATIHGCDSIVTLNLILNSPKSKDTVVDYACDSLTWTWGNGLFYDANTTAPYPSHVVSLGPGKCDSTTYLILVLKHSTHNIENTTACDSFIWHGQGPYKTTSTQTYNYINAVGCASTDTLHLTINIGTDRYDTVHACDFYTWNGIPFSADTLNDDLPHKYGLSISPDPLCHYNDSLVLFMFKNTGHRLPADTACISKLWIRRNTTAITLNETGIYYNSSFENTPYTHFGHNGTWNCAFTDTLDLTILNTSMRTNDVHACDNYQWTRTINGEEVINRTVTSVPAIGYVTQDYPLTVGSYTCSGAETMRDTLDIVIGHNTALPTTRLDTACNYFDWWNEDMTEYAGHFTTSINDTTHTFTNASGCDSAVTLSLVINRGDTSGHVELACDEFVWNMIHYTADDTITDIHYDENGCVAIDTIYLTVKNRARTTIDTTACDTYTWDFNGQTYTTSQTITDTMPGSNGCDSIVTLHLTVNHNTSHSDTVDVCDTYIWHGNTYTASGSDTIYYTNDFGCLSRDTLNLTIRHNSNTTTDSTVCDSARWHGTLYTTSDDHLYNYISSEGCPSTDTLRLQVNRSVRFVESIFACDSLTWRDDSTYTASSDMVSLFHTTTPEGCDSSIWLSLTVKYSSEIPVPDSAKACDYYNWAVKTGYMGANGFVQTDLKVLNVNTTGVHKTEFCKNAAGCDSLRVLNLSLRYRDTADATAEGCGSYSYYSTQYTSNSQHDTVLTVFHKETRNYANRCDSVTRLHLTLHPVKDQNAPEYTTACDAYTWNGRTYRTSGNYESRDTTMYGCDSISTLILVLNHADSTQHDSAVVCDQTTWMGKIYRNTGIYRDTITTHEGCDSIRILYLTVHHRTHNRIDTTVCDYIYWPNDVTYDTISTTTYGVVTHLTYPYLYGCEQVDTLYLTVKNSTTIEFDSSVCDSVRWYSPTNRQGEWYKTSGDIQHTFLDKNSQNCDSSLLMHLTVHPTLLQVETLASCDSVMWHGAWLTTSQNVGLTYDSTYSDGRQCRVTDSLYFTRNGNNVYRQNESKFACDTFTWSRNTMTYAESGTYTDTLRNAAGCDSSIATLVLTIAYGNYDTLDTVSCHAPVEWNDSTYAVQGTYVIADTTPQGCPSLQILILHTGYYDTLGATSKCERYTWNGIEYSHEGYSLVADTHTTAFGCDSNTYLPLTIIKSQRTRIDTALFGPEYFWALHNKTYTQPGTYIDTIDYSLSMNCGRIDTLVLQLTNVPLPQILANTSHTIIMLNHYPDGEDGDRVDYEVYRWYMDGVLQNGKTTDVFNNRDWSSLNGHYYYLEVLYNNMWLRSNTVDLRTTGIDEATESIDFAIYPNPVISGRTLTMTLQGDNLDLHGATLTVFDLHGRDLLNTAVSGERTSLSADLPAGVYNLRLTLSDGRTAVKKLIVR